MGMLCYASDDDSSSLLNKRLTLDSSMNYLLPSRSYVDAQLRTSKRFDASGLKESNPEFFKPLYRRRSSSTASMSTLSGFVSDASVGGYASRSSRGRGGGNNGGNGNGTNGTGTGTGAGEDGQLRYWTSEMCSSQPHLFDMVVTVSNKLYYRRSDSRTNSNRSTSLLRSSAVTARSSSPRGSFNGSYPLSSPLHSARSVSSQTLISPTMPRRWTRPWTTGSGSTSVCGLHVPSTGPSRPNRLRRPLARNARPSSREEEISCSTRSMRKGGKRWRGRDTRTMKRRPRQRGKRTRRSCAFRPGPWRRSRS
jgi:hypothetical protein